MKLKCIGGKSNGIVVDVESARIREGDSVRVPTYPTNIGECDWRMNPEPVVSVDYQIYQIDVLKYNEGKNGVGEIWFLRPTNFTKFDAIQFQFNKV